MKTETQDRHTPGPEINYYRQYALPLRVLRADRSKCNESRSKEMEACIADNAGKVVCYLPLPANLNVASLLCAAPDLLAACIACVKQWEDWAAFDGCADEIPAEIALARAAIAKARGEAK